ncbi:MAG TPA: hypothetical protein VFL85_00430 [Candidatus Saccharimonadales bacterium]|nr:hypothetical protein [Candidatus Saccharimonadales bacterium]
METVESRPRLHHVRKVFKKTHDPLWQMQLGVLIVIGLQLLTNKTFLPFSKIWMVVPEVTLLLALIIVTTEGYQQFSQSRRNLAMTLIGLIAAINIFSLILLIDILFLGHQDVSGRTMLMNGLVIYITNIFMFALWYWEMDGNGPDRRTSLQSRRDFLFPQMIHSRYGGENWLPGFADYVYLSTTNVTNFASADTLPLSHRAKLLMMTQSLVAVITVVLVLARAINILQ